MLKMEFIDKQIKSLSNYDSFLNRKELELLPQHLTEEEQILFITNATNKNHSGLCVVTNERILFVSIEVVIEEEREDIEFVYHEKHDAFSEVQVFSHKKKIYLDNILNNDVTPLLTIIDPHFVHDEEEYEKPNSWLPFVVVIGIFLVIIAGIIQDYFYHNESTANTNLISLETAQSEYDLFFSSLNFYPIDDLNYLSGIISNQSNQEYSSILIDIEFYDKEGNVKERAKERIYNLKPNQTWSFKEDFQSKEIVDFKLTGLLVRELTSK